MSLHDTILANIGDSGTRAVEVPEWGVTVKLRQFTVAEFMALVSEGDDDGRPWRILAAAVVDEKGKPALTEKQIIAMPASQSKVLMRLVSEVQDMNGMNEPGEA